MLNWSLTYVLHWPFDSKATPALRPCSPLFVELVVVVFQRLLTQALDLNVTARS